MSIDKMKSKIIKEVLDDPSLYKAKRNEWSRLGLTNFDQAIGNSKASPYSRRQLPEVDVRHPLKLTRQSGGFGYKASELRDALSYMIDEEGIDPHGHFINDWTHGYIFFYKGNREESDTEFSSRVKRSMTQKWSRLDRKARAIEIEEDKRKKKIKDAEKSLKEALKIIEDSGVDINDVIEDKYKEKLTVSEAAE
jgi:hypothetical protein